MLGEDREEEMGKGDRIRGGERGWGGKWNRKCTETYLKKDCFCELKQVEL